MSLDASIPAGPPGSCKKPIHTGHRERLRRQFLMTGAEGLSDINILELLLFYGIPQRDTNPIAHRLLERFGSLAGVFSASTEDLVRQGGLGEYAAALIRLTAEIARMQQIQRTEERFLCTTEEYGDYLLPHFFGLTEETVYLLSLDGKCKPLACNRLFTGSVNSASLSIRLVVECALRTKATSVVLAHNHPSGIAVPSQEDIKSTRAIAEALEPLNVLLLDHIVVAEGDFVSMLESGFLNQKKQENGQEGKA